MIADVPLDDEIARAARERVRARLQAEIAAAIAGGDAVAAAPAPFDGDALVAPPARRRARRAPRAPRRRRLPLIVAGGLAAAAAGVVALVSGLGEGRVSPPASAAAVLRAAAAAAAHGPAPGAIPPGRYLYVRTTHMDPHVIHHRGQTFTAYIRYVDEDWTARDGSGRNRSTPTTPTFPTAADRAAYERAGSPSEVAMVGHELQIMGDVDVSSPGVAKHAFPARAGGMGSSYAQIRALPADPQALGRILSRRVSRFRLPWYTAATRDAVVRGNTLEWIGRLLGAAPLDADQRAALLRLAASLPGVELSGDAVDRLGRQGTAVRLDVRAVRTDRHIPPQLRTSRSSVTLVVDPATGALLGTRLVATDGSGKVVTDLGAVYSAKVVASDR
jgi:hypothetical protein